jgi:hypothetical protein
MQHVTLITVIKLFAKFPRTRTHKLSSKHFTPIRSANLITHNGNCRENETMKTFWGRHKTYIHQCHVSIYVDEHQRSIKVSSFVSIQVIISVNNWFDACFCAMLGVNWWKNVFSNGKSFWEFSNHEFHEKRKWNVETHRFLAPKREVCCCETKKARCD